MDTDATVATPQIQPQPDRRRFTARVLGDNPAEMEQAALAEAAEFFFPETGLEVERNYVTWRSSLDDKAYVSWIYVRVAEAWS